MAVRVSLAWLWITTNPSKKEALQRLATALASLIMSPQVISRALSEATSKELLNCVWPCFGGGATANFIVKLIGSADVSSMGLCTLITVKYLPGASVFPTGRPQTNFALYRIGVCGSSSIWPSLNEAQCSSSLGAAAGAVPLPPQPDVDGIWAAAWSAGSTSAGVAAGCVWRKRAAPPATCGAACEVPEKVLVAVSFAMPAERMLTPGAKSLRQVPKLEKLAPASVA